MVDQISQLLDRGSRIAEGVHQRSKNEAEASEKLRETAELLREILGSKTGNQRERRREEDRKSLPVRNPLRRSSTAWHLPPDNNNEDSTEIKSLWSATKPLNPQ